MSHGCGYSGYGEDQLMGELMGLGLFLVIVVGVSYVVERVKGGGDG